MAELSAFTPDQIELIRGQIAVGCSDDEVSLFLHVCRSRGLDPFARQIWAIRRRTWDPIARAQVDKMTIQTSIDGFRLIAKRAGLDAIDEPEFTYDLTIRDNLNPLGLVKATVRVWPKNSSRPTVAAAYWDEYRQSGDRGLTGQWGKMPRTMLAKCAEALALRRGCPEELSGLYTSDEMEQSEPAQMQPQTIARQVATKSAPLLAVGKVDNLRAQLAAAVTPEEFAAIAKSAATLPAAERDVFRARFKARKAAIAAELGDAIPEPSAPVSEELPLGPDMSPDEAYATSFGLAIERADSVTDLEVVGNEIRAAKDIGFVPPKSLSAAYRAKMRELAERDLS